MPNWKEGEVRTEMRRSTYLPIFDKGNTPCILFVHNLFSMFLGVVDRVLDVYPYGYIGSAITDPIREFSKYGDISADGTAADIVNTPTTTTTNNDTDDDDDDE